MVKTVTALFGASAFSFALLYVVKTTDWHSLCSLICEHFSRKGPIDSDLVKDVFARMEVSTPKHTTGHTHPAAASNRSGATAFARVFACRLGTDLYSVQMSRADQRKSLRGSRSFFWAKDANAEAIIDLDKERYVKYLCDVDYYVDMPAMLTDQPRTTLLYTLVPEAAANVTDDNTSFWFHPDGTVESGISGSGSYRHYLWDYGVDSFLAIKRTWLSIPIQVIAYAVERKQVAKHRQMILITPLKVFSGVIAALAAVVFEKARPIGRFLPLWFSPNGQQFIRFKVKTKDNLYVTVAQPEGTACATIPTPLDDNLHLITKQNRGTITLGTIESWIGHKNKEMAPVLAEFHQANVLKIWGRTVYTVFPVEKAVRTVIFHTINRDGKTKVKLHAFMSLIIHGAFTPANDKASEEQCVRGRIEAVKMEEPAPDPFVDTCMLEFADLVMCGMELTPVSIETVKDKQNRTQQRQSIYRAEVSGPHVKGRGNLKCFVKAEAYSDVKDPRCISTYNDVDKLAMSRFALALSEHCKRFPWYGPGKTPLEIAQRVAKICEESKRGVNISDYHRMDGTVTYYLREVDRMVFLRAFPLHGGELSDLLRTNANNVGHFPEGTTFKQGYAHGSGCPATSVAQTLRAAFATYLAYRHTKSEGGSWYTPEQAFAKLGLHLGDDGIDGDLAIEEHKWSASKVGLLLEANFVPREERGVNFLARYYSPTVWFGSTDSMCDISRQLSKFHTTVRLPDNVSATDKLVEKALSYVATDANTPVIGALCRRAVEYCPNYTPKYGVGAYWGQFDRNVQYPNENTNGWMDDELKYFLPEFATHVFDDWLAGLRSLEEMLEAPLCNPIKTPSPTTVPVIVDDVYIPAKQQPTPEAPKAQPGPNEGSRTSDNKKRQRKRPDKTKKNRLDESAGPPRAPAEAPARAKVGPRNQPCPPRGTTPKTRAFRVKASVSG